MNFSGLLIRRSLVRAQVGEPNLSRLNQCLGGFLLWSLLSLLLWLRSKLYPKICIFWQMLGTTDGLLLAWSAFIHTVRQSKSIRAHFKSGMGLPAARGADGFAAEAA